MAREGVNLSYITAVRIEDTPCVLDVDHVYFECGPHPRMTFATMLEELLAILPKGNDTDTVTVHFLPIDEYFAAELELISVKDVVQPILTAQ